MNATYSEKWQRLRAAVPFFALLAVISGIYGFLYEFVFYYINGDMKELYWRGSHFLPWIMIYSVGGVIIYLLTGRLQKHPLLVALVGGIGCGVLEYISGVVYLAVWGLRGWDYNTEKWNWGNINGFICLRSIVVFAVSSLLLVYLICPFLRFLRTKMGEKGFAVLSLTLAGCFLADQLYNSVLTKLIPSLMTANAFYAGLGLQILQY